MTVRRCPAVAGAVYGRPVSAAPDPPTLRAALRRCVLSVVVLDDLDLEPAEEGVRVPAAGGDELVPWSDVAAAAGAPAGVALQDNRDSVTLTWAYPKGAEGPVLISGGRRGQAQRAFQQLPAGSADYVVYGLDGQLDYCFTVSVVHSTDRVAASPPVCTARR